MKNGNEPLNQHQFESKMNAAVMEYSMLRHPFYRAWSEGRLSQSVLAEYAKQYYAHVRAFPTYVSAVHSHCDNLETRQELLENLIEEERGAENHPELWLRFAEGLGVPRAEVTNAELLPATASSVDRLKAITRSEDYREGLAALYAYESQIPEVARTKRAGLKDFYGMTDERAVSFFRVHESIDLLHQDVAMQILNGACKTAEEQSAAIAAAAEGAKALWGFLDGVAEAYLPAAIDCSLPTAATA
ncbi:MAG: pyrroloquinoline-quinone synthase [Blastocatellia bacterium]|jgi:pyrroloquinoline-quinone synthase|nr:pyrroloquinoline-quinone synthase [Blastocatellia bacterium]